MTASVTAPEAAAELAPVSAAKRVLARPGVSLLDVLQAIAGESVARLPEVTPAAPAKPKEIAPKPIVLTQELIDALTRFVTEAEAVKGELPEKRAKLTSRQRGSLGKLYRSANRIKVDINKLITDTIRVAWFNHFDVLAEQTDGFDADGSLRDKSGFFIAAAEEDVEGVGTVKREVRAGTPDVDLNVIERAVAQGRLPKTATNGITRQVRILDSEKAVRWFAKNPQFADVLAEATTVTGASGSLNLR